MTIIKERAAVARRLATDEGLLSIAKDIRDAAAAVFLNPSASLADIEAAHRKVQAVSTIFDALQARIDAESIEDKREKQHRDKHD